MNFNLVKKNNAQCDAAAVKAISDKFGLHPRFAELLISRGVDTEEKVRKYLYPEIGDFYDPMLMKGMAEAVARLETAIAEKQKVVIYGDYDADGVCASAILSLYLSSRGLEVYVHIPNRVGDGYGLNVDSIEEIIDRCCPDLILTCDCGISGSEEVAYAMDLGVDVIVTDHHEVAEVIPECIVVNPKQSDCGYPYAYLCGAGVAFKLVHALGGLEAALQFADLAAVATVADLVPLLDENRLIVQLGLKKLEEKQNIGLRQLVEDQKLTYPVRSGDVAYKIAPRINAAGRMGDAYRAFELLTSADTARVQAIAEEMDRDNSERKILCDKLYAEAMEDLKFEDLVNSRSVILSNPEWEKGITGILAARLAGDFNRPTFIMVNSGDYYKGTSRSIPGINIYELLSSVGDILVEFGGHSGAAGFSIEEKNIPVFRKRVNEYLDTLDVSLFEPNQEYDMEIDARELDIEFASQLEKIEPSGNSNTAPLFKTTVEKLSVTPCKNNHAHTQITLESGLGVLAFNFYERNQFLMGDGKKDLVLELQLNKFGGRENAKGILKTAAPSELYINDIVARVGYLKTLSYGFGKKDDFIGYKPEELADIVGERAFGTLVIAGCESTYRKYAPVIKADKMLNEFLYSTTQNNYSRIIVSPEMGSGFMLSGYDKVVFLDTPPAYALAAFIAQKSKAKIYVPAEENEKAFFEGLDTSREKFGECFTAIRRFTAVSADNILAYAKSVSARADISPAQLVAGIMVFTELGLIKVTKNPFSATVNSGVHADLADSRIYSYMKNRCEG